LRAVIDTNVLLARLRWRGAPREQQAEGTKLDAAIAANLNKLGYGG